MSASSQNELSAQIAERTRRPLDEVQALCAQTWQRLSSDARVHDYLPLLVEKSVCESLKHESQR